MKRVIESGSCAETLGIATELGRSASRGDIITLSGELGAGKTLFAGGIAAGMGIDGYITSPTFSLMDVHEGTIPLYHFDLYRIEKPSELEELFFEEYWEGDGISVIEWPERAEGRLPRRVTAVTIEYTGPESRRITIEHPDN
ncbi:MAG TPA: tRNA (adenosine(37)-N6)-threonylcarbamoyltransferase complex ATPase subunit type 1 TsaE [Spirochaetota bacterium]|nr:tRNA (adenosine(37)-N6)-threonylcarbamoyltransferase complex ATPase subunit type 1 TsaE [Spirochaetota bacterium]HQO39698.1 tRNA (adenosine(37)-N6)-threonylcarbamoyltransferase complex ATPase subunit type 1 TsaE [Spirochaetota bacterium]